jgi:hypothetical protein
MPWPQNHIAELSLYWNIFFFNISTPFLSTSLKSRSTWRYEWSYSRYNIHNIFFCFNYSLMLMMLKNILDASVSIIRAYNEILRGHTCLIDLVIDIFNNYLRLRSTTTPTGKLHGALYKCQDLKQTNKKQKF